METCQIQEGAAIYYLTFAVIEVAWRFSSSAYWLLDPAGESDVMRGKRPLPVVHSSLIVDW